MKSFICVLIFLLFLFLGDVRAQSTDLADKFFGTWVIDLRPSPKSDPYLKNFKIEKLEDGYVGEFYDSPIEGFMINDVWDALRFAFITHDASNTYYHSGIFKNGQLEGFTYCPDREFAMPWFGVEKK